VTKARNRRYPKIEKFRKKGKIITGTGRKILLRKLPEDLERMSDEVGRCDSEQRSGINGAGQATT
jgi:hypothetical protein